MDIDIGGALAETASPGVSRDALETLDDAVARAHNRIQRGRENDEHGYAALNLPEQVDPTAIRAVTDGFDDIEAVLVAGIGGSALGAAAIGKALDLPIYTLDNVDPAATDRLLASLPLEQTVLVAVSRSGTTAETLANFLVAREAFVDAGIDWTDHTLVITGESGPLAGLSETNDLPRLAVPEGVPGRYSVLAAVGLAPAALAGADIEALLAGGADTAATLSDSLFACPAYAYGAVAYALDIRGAGVNAMMPYAEGLETFAEWFAQLWAESLGKDGLGQTPVRALGATDQHSQLQLYRAGRKDKLVTLLRPREREDEPIPETDIESLSYLGGDTLGGLLDAEFEATEASLAAAGQANVRLEVDRLDAESVGRLLYELEAACVLVGELAGVETFTQPAVEWGKRAARGLLGGGDFEEATAVEEKTVRRVE